MHAKQVGSARIKHINGSIATLTAIGSSAELRLQDRLFPRQDPSRVTAVYPRSLDHVIEGQVLAVPEGLRKAGFLDIVALNRGTRNGLNKGATMGVYQAGNSIRTHSPTNGFLHSRKHEFWASYGGRSAPQRRRPRR